ncbi:Fic family protein [Collimonas sp.]|jgi:Fic family protein|uniref:Fic family protein n=1 Tax=Collimonas sp. TaxID=1963772 RepID=UPI002BC97C60|nr:Fic/DOC family N-terminal domain-containing protein [Collimonas sp.]HWW05711.1 Fic/DOC family N-terminal domain-containing protein [Collimonas sp.]
MPKLPAAPPSLPVLDLNWQKLMPLMSRANAALGRYDGLLRSLPNAAVLLSPITTNEAVLSSRIEGTQATLEEVLQQDGGVEPAPERQADMEEVRNYRNALFAAEEALEHRPLSLSIIKEIHQSLMQGVRGQDKTPGQFRVDQNWIGRPGCAMDEARFVPPNPMVLPQALEAWAAYISSTDDDPVLQIAVVHAQFEILHPFKDGNGRIGRMLIPLLLFQRGLLSRPMFYLSEYLESHREEYYDRLLLVTEQGDWQGWVEFFTEGVISQADTNLAKAQKMLALYNKLKPQFIEATRSQFAVPALDAFFRKPIINSTDFAKRAGIANRFTSNAILKTLTDLDLIQVFRAGAGRNPHIYMVSDLLNIAEGRDIF